MSTPHTFFGKLIAGILSIFKSSAVKIWDGLTPEEQEAIKNASGIINIINTHISEAPEIIKAEIIKVFPDEPKIEAALVELCKSLHITLPTLDLTSAIKSIQGWLASKEGTVWEWGSSALAQGLTIFLNPSLSIFAKITMVIEYAYRTYIAK